MRKWQTIAVTALSTMALSGAGFTAYQMNQPTHYEGVTFTNEKESSTHSTSNSMASSTTDNGKSSAIVTDSSSDTSAPAQSNSVAQAPVQTAPTTPAPSATYDELTFTNGSCDNVNGVDVTYVYCEQSHDMTDNIPLEDAQPFIAWLYSVTEGEHYMTNSIQSNYNYWVQNVKGQQ